MTSVCKIVKFNALDRQWQELVKELRRHPTREDIQQYLTLHLEELRTLTGLPEQEIRVWFVGTCSRYYRGYPRHCARAREVLSKLHA